MAGRRAAWATWRRTLCTRSSSVPMGRAVSLAPSVACSATGTPRTRSRYRPTSIPPSRRRTPRRSPRLPPSLRRPWVWVRRLSRRQAGCLAASLCRRLALRRRPCLCLLLAAGPMAGGPAAVAPDGRAACWGGSVPAGDASWFLWRFHARWVGWGWRFVLRTELTNPFVTHAFGGSGSPSGSGGGFNGIAGMLKTSRAQIGVASPG